MDIVKLNIGGEKHVQVMRNTLVQAEGSLLDAMFKGDWENSLIRDEDGNVFIDQSARLFIPLLEYLRARRDESPNGGPHAEPPKNLGPAFDVMVEYYQMTMFVYRLEIRVLSMPPPQHATIKNMEINKWSMQSPNEWVTFDLNRICHDKQISKYTVVMGEFSSARIGWRDADELYPAYDKTPQPKARASYCTAPSKGVGDFPGTIGFDCLDDLFYSVYTDGNLSQAPGQTRYSCPFPLETMYREGDSVRPDIGQIQQGTKIECFRRPPKEHDELYRAERPVWVVDGIYLDSIVTFDWARTNAVPCISVQGNLEIVEVLYDNGASTN